MYNYKVLMSEVDPVSGFHKLMLESPMQRRNNDPEYLSMLSPMTLSFLDGGPNGYVGIPKDHPLFGVRYNLCIKDSPCEETWCGHAPENIVRVHGGITFSDSKLANGSIDGYWYFGFDTAHYGDTAETCTEVYVKGEIERLADQLAQIDLSAV